MEHFLISIIPSENIAIKIRKLRTLIFKKYGLVSSRSLPEIIPVAFTKEIINRKQFQELILSSEMESSNCILTGENDIFLQINNTDYINSIQKIINNYKSSGFITLKPGIYLGSAEKNLDTKEIIEFIDIEKEKIPTWKKNNLELIKIETFGNIWWENIRWETIWKQKINLK
ncbi:MAG: hypothetical protein KAQ93_04720 [Spirochaetales bacterium]|nr:hypothetical protein [Spirochaetales bacterium]